MSPKPRRVLGYARVSSEAQSHNSSIEGQKATIVDYARSKGYPAPKLYTEAESAVYENTERRVQMQALMSTVKVGDLVLCDKIDRWSRDPEFTYGSVRKIKERGAAIYFIGDACDPLTDEGDSVLGSRILQAREEGKRIKQRMVGTRNRLQREGYYASGVPPLGYRRQTEARDRRLKNVLVIVPEGAALVRTIFKRYIAGASMTKLANELGIKLDLVKDTLHRRVYLGEVQAPPKNVGKRDGDWIKGRHEPIIDRVTFDKAQKAIEERRTTRTPHSDGAAETSTWIFRDVARCGHCGAKLSAAYGKKEENRRHYYKCFKQCQAKGAQATTRSYIPVGPIEELAYEHVQDRIEAIRTALGQPADKELTKAPAVDFAAKRKTLSDRRERTLDLFTNGDIDRENLNTRLAKIDAQLQKLEVEQEAAETPHPLAEPKVRREMLKDVREIQRALSGVTPGEMRNIVNAFVASVAFVNGKAPVFTWRTGEDVYERLDAVREDLLKGLGRAPTHAETIKSLCGDMVNAWGES